MAGLNLFNSWRRIKHAQCLAYKHLVERKLRFGEKIEAVSPLSTDGVPHPEKQLLNSLIKKLILRNVQCPVNNSFCSGVLHLFAKFIPIF